MSVEKQVIDRERVRRIPPSFSWVDHRLVQEGSMERCPHPALSLYLFLATVGDSQGLSSWSDRTAGARLHLAPDDLAKARNELVRADLVAFAAPIHQVLDLKGGRR